jgi:hypothetical protein
MHLLEKVLNTVEFRDRLLAMKFTNNLGKTNLQIYNKILSGSETLSSETDYEIDIDVQMYHENNRVVGWTKPSVIWTKLNRKFFNQYNYAEIACNAFHEWLHKIGFDHSSARDHKSIPYSLGYLVEDMIKEMEKGVVFTTIEGEYLPVPEIPTHTPKLVCYRSWRTWFKKKCYYV